ncbi:MAG TPA: tetratricopeptide repeat protein [Chthonomonadales bacterium]|nr:tetratricopeptide repeat protein [Chthonomonadales bacterium]
MATGDRSAEQRARADADAAAIESLHVAVAALAIAAADDPALVRPHAVACHRLAERLAAADRVPEAAQAFQEAADAYARLPDGDAEARDCARAVVDRVRSLWRRPEQRLMLLVTRHDRDIRRLEQQAGSEAERARIAFHLGTILQRCDRFAIAAARYAQALSLYQAVPGADLDVAACHQRLAGLFHHELHDRESAKRHYRAAIELYRAHEPAAEGEQMERALCEELLRCMLETTRSDP